MLSSFAFKSNLRRYNTTSADEFWRELTILTALDCPRWGGAG
jgi:hypothetical protein